MNTVLCAADCLPRGGRVVVETGGTASQPRFTVKATGAVSRLTAETEQALKGDSSAGLDGRSVQPYLTYLLSNNLKAGLTARALDGQVEFTAGSESSSTG